METFDYDNVYRVTEYDQRAFDGYTAQPVLLLDEFRSSFKISQMLNYLDGYPLKLPCRFEDCQACYTTVFIISNISLYEQYTNIQSAEPTTWRAFLRRIHAVYRFDNPTDKEKLLAVLKDCDTIDEPYTQEIVAEIKRAAEVELVPVEDADSPW
jgi:hypothetical protein